jgi:hypothetical protein
MRPRLAVPATYQFSIRYLVHTGLLARLTEFSDPVVLLSWDDPELIAALEAMGVEAHLLVSPQRSQAYLALRRRLDLLHERQLASPTSRIDWRRRDALRRPSSAVKHRIRRRLITTSFMVPGVADRAHTAEARLVRSETNLDEVGSQIDALHLDAVLSVTPYHQQEDLFLRSASLRSLPSLASMISFDNITTRGWIPVLFDRYLVWNHHNAAQIARAYPAVDHEQVVVTGAPQFDFYVGDEWRWSEDRWREELGLPADRPVILFAGGPEVIVPHEPSYLVDLDAAISRGEVPGDPILLFRRHPIEPIARWQPYLDRTRNVIMDEPWAVRTGDLTTSSATVDDIERLVSTLEHAQVHVNTSSTMTVDGAYFDRPQVGPAYDEGGRAAERQVRDLYRREHWLPITASGGMDIAESRQAMVAAVRDGFAEPGARQEGRRRLVSEIITRRDGRATERVATGVAAELGAPRPTPGPPGAPHLDRGSGAIV